MGERTAYVYESEPKAQDSGVDFEPLDARGELMDRFADTPMVYMLNGVPQHASGSYDAVRLCEYLQGDDITIGFLEVKFEEAAQRAKDLQAEEEKEGEPKVEAPDDDKFAAQEAVTEQKTDQQMPVKDPKIETPNSPVEMAADNLTTRPQAAGPILEFTAEQKTAPAESDTVAQDDSEPLITTEPSVVAESTFSEKRVADVEVYKTDVNNRTSEPIIEHTVDSVEGNRLLDAPRISHNERVAEATQVVMDVFEAQDTEDEPQNVVHVVPVEKERSLNEQLPIQRKEPLPPSEVVSTTVDGTDSNKYANAEEAAPIPVVEFGTLRHAPDAVPGNMYDNNEQLDEETIDADDYLTVEPESYDDVTEHVRTLTAILEAEQAASGHESDTDTRVNEDNIDETKETMQLGEHQAVESNIEMDPNNEIVQTNVDIKEILEAITIAVPEAAASSNIVELTQHLDNVIQKIDTLQAAVSAEDCREAVEALKGQLTLLLEVIGCHDASAEATRLLKHWQYDMESLKWYMASLQKAIVAAQGAMQATKKANNVTTLYKHYGARAVHMAVSFAKQPLHVRRAAA